MTRVNEGSHKFYLPPIVNSLLAIWRKFCLHGPIRQRRLWERLFKRRFINGLTYLLTHMYIHKWIEPYLPLLPSRRASLNWPVLISVPLRVEGWLGLSVLSRWDLGHPEGTWNTWEQQPLCVVCLCVCEMQLCGVQCHFSKQLMTAKVDEGDLLLKQSEDGMIARLKMFIHLRQDLERVRFSDVTVGPEIARERTLELKILGAEN